MGQPAARQGDQVVGIDIHVVIVPAVIPIPMPLPHPFSGPITTGTVPSVLIEGAPAATVDSVATNQPPHLPTPPGTSFAKPPTNRGSVSFGSGTVTIGGKPAARLGDPVRTCNDPVDADTSAIVTGAPTVLIG
ncbi:MAG: hypothetical protein QOD24_1817 [Solirubrobacteraceae bacterium]|jgi:uncharacterized Zn-binding protein involved in type VI secretion|nr:hypothetical protein [Solirubrobacteraceae bacterium]